MRRIVASLREVPAILRAMLRQPAFYLLAIGSMASIGAVGGTMQNLKLYLSLDRGFGEAQARQRRLARAARQPRRPAADGLARGLWPKKHVMLLIYMIVAVAIPLVCLAPSRRSAHGGGASSSASASAGTT